MVKRTNTRRRILDIAERLLMQRGYHAFSYQHIAAELGVKPAAIHYHFRTKPDLVVAAIERYGERFDAWAASVAGRSPRERLLGYFAIGRMVVADDRICALGMLNTQFATIPAEVQQITVAVQGRILAFYTETLAAGRALGELDFPGEPRDKSAEIGSTLVGAQQLARAHGAHVYDRVMGQQARALGMSDEWSALLGPTP